MKPVFLILITTVTFAEIFADFLFKKWVIGSNKWFLIIGICAYLISTIFWAFSLRYESLSKAISIFTILSLIVVVLMGVYVFNEHLSITNVIGIVLGIVSIILVSL